MLTLKDPPGMYVKTEYRRPEKRLMSQAAIADGMISWNGCFWPNLYCANAVCKDLVR
ncbi:hypothetical protein CY34DRAFT_806952 [Suillus luteus UH-Slu-Lm8-n1]|uniref:Uncharacterized protein n=1 Tax=Suillus luteus UH-Slu-Lm8-n1 TaxID=930992 RepID=A0A0D0ARL1_9AGAM|nr:hypothetical protein CY34DRAFT_806952 [Suillus luteus UH-Slu-Lm8-n1]